MVGVATTKETPWAYKIFAISLVPFYVAVAMVCFYLNEDGFRLKLSGNVQNSVGVIAVSDYGRVTNTKSYHVKVIFPDAAQQVREFIDSVGANTIYEKNQSVRVLYDASGEKLIAKIEDNMSGVMVYLTLLTGMFFFFVYLAFVSLRRARQLENI